MNRNEKLSTEIPGSKPVFEPITQEERVRNRNIAIRMKNLLEKHDSSSNTTLAFMDLELVRKDPDYAFIIFLVEKKGSKLPKNISYPLYALALDNQARRFKNDDEKIYHVQITHLFNEKGQGITSLFIKKEDPKIYTPAVASNYSLLSVPAKHMNTFKFFSIKDENFLKIEALIAKAESEGWNKQRVLKPHTVIITKSA